MVGVPIEFDFSGTIDQALRWHPKARHLVVVTGTAPWDREFEARLRGEVSHFQDRATAEFLAVLPTGAVLKRLGELGGETVVFTPGYFQDGEGRHFAPREAARIMAAAATAPVYVPFNTFMGTGVVGGRMPSFAAMGRQAGQIVNGLLNGAVPVSLRLPEIMLTTLNVDWRQIRRWGIDENAIPGDAVVHFKAPTFIEMLGFHLDIWDYLTFATLFVLVAAVLFFVWIAGIARPDRHRPQAPGGRSRQAPGVVVAWLEEDCMKPQQPVTTRSFMSLF